LQTRRGLEERLTRLEAQCAKTVAEAETAKSAARAAVQEKTCVISLPMSCPARDSALCDWLRIEENPNGPKRLYHLVRHGCSRAASESELREQHATRTAALAAAERDKLARALETSGDELRVQYSQARRTRCLRRDAFLPLVLRLPSHVLVRS